MFGLLTARVMGGRVAKDAWFGLTALLSLGCGARSGLELGAVPVIRQIFPLSTERVTSQRPTLRWQLNGSADGARVELCRTRACDTPELSADVKGTSFRPDRLAPGVHYWKLTAERGGVSSFAQTPTWEFFVPRRDTPIDSAWGSVLDLNGDGHADAVVAPLLTAGQDVNASPGCLAVYSGGNGGLTRDLVLAGPGTADGQFGASADSAGDVNGDGYGDLVVGASCDPAIAVGENGHACNGTGRVNVFNGGPGGVSARRSAELDGVKPQVFLGTRVGALGDVNGDGYGDFFATSSMLSSTTLDNYPGSVLLFLGGADGPVAAAVLTGPDRDGFSDQGEARFGAAPGGDLNGDGYDDLIVSAWCSPGSTSGCRGGSVRVYLGSPTGFADPPFLMLRDTVETDPRIVFGGAVAGGLDLNGDGYSDFLVGVVACTDVLCNATGRIDVHLGGPSGPQAHPDFSWQGPRMPVTTSDGYGLSIVPLGDINGDGFDDVVVNTPVCDLVAGEACDLSNSAYVYFGSASPNENPSQTIAAPDHSLGASEFFAIIRAPGDIDGDGLADAVAGALAYASVGPADLYTFRGTPSGLPAGPTTRTPWPFVDAECR